MISPPPLAARKLGTIVSKSMCCGTALQWHRDDALKTGDDLDFDVDLVHAGRERGEEVAEAGVQIEHILSTAAG